MAYYALHLWSQLASETCQLRLQLLPAVSYTNKGILTRQKDRNCLLAPALAVILLILNASPNCHVVDVRYVFDDEEWLDEQSLRLVSSCKDGLHFMRCQRIHLTAKFASC